MFTVAYVFCVALFFFGLCITMKEMLINRKNKLVWFGFALMTPATIILIYALYALITGAAYEL